MDRKEYDQLAESLKPTGQKMKNAFYAFLYGGVIGAIAQGVLEFFMNVYHVKQEDATPMMIITLVFISCLLTGLGIYDKLAQKAGAGTFIPITGFANSMTCLLYTSYMSKHSVWLLEMFIHLDQLLELKIQIHHVMPVNSG